jgi:hypothetical protein
MFSMEQKFDTSFIPKQSLQTDIAGGQRSYVRRRSVMGPGYFLTLFIFIMTCLVAGGLFFYTRIVINDIESNNAELERMNREFDSVLIEDFIRKDARLRHARSLLERHIAASSMFQVLESITLRTIAYEKLHYRLIDQAGNIEVNFTGVTRGRFEPVALQMDQFRDNPYFRSPTVTSLELGEQLTRFTGFVRVDRSLISYARALADNSVPTPPVVTTPAPTPVVPEAEEGLERVQADITLPEAPDSVIGGIQE